MSWRDEYMQALQERNTSSSPNYELIDAYTKLVDRAISLEAEKAATISTQAEGALPCNENVTSAKVITSAANSGVTPSELQLQSTLAEVLRHKGQLESRLKITKEELSKVTIQVKNDADTIRELAIEKVNLSIRLKDKIEELKGKAKLLEDVQDEMISVTLQRNMSEQRNETLQKENKELVDRWMTRMGLEAEAMNDASAFS